MWISTSQSLCLLASRSSLQCILLVLQGPLFDDDISLFSVTSFHGTLPPVKRTLLQATSIGFCASIVILSTCLQLSVLFNFLQAAEKLRNLPDLHYKVMLELNFRSAYVH